MHECCASSQLSFSLAPSLHYVRPSKLESEFEITVKYVDMHSGSISHYHSTGLDVYVGKLANWV